MNSQKNIRFHFSEEENKILDADIISHKLLKETCLLWWYKKINKKDHEEILGFNEVMNEIKYSPPTKTMKNGGILFQKGKESFFKLQNQ